MNRKSFSNTLVIILVLVVIAGIAGYFIFSPKEGTELTAAEPSLSADKKNIIGDGNVLLAIGNDVIFNWFKTESQLCDGDNRTSVPDRKMFCENKAAFEGNARFASIVVSPDKMKIGFTIETDTLSPDKVAGIFLLPAKEVRLLTNYYLGNEFISFSPTGINFVYRSYCFEGDCGFTIKNSDTLADKISFGDTPDHSDYRFTRWISDEKIEYKDGMELKQRSF